MSTLRYLAYGSNLHPGRLAARVGEVRPLEVVRLDGWALSFCKRGADGSGKCMIERRPGASAWGVVFAIAASARATLDRVEGAGRGYAASWLDLGESGRCYVYLPNDSHVDRSLVPYDWYKALVVAGARRHALPPDYLAVLENTAATEDPDRRRAASNLAVLESG